MGMGFTARNGSAPRQGLLLVGWTELHLWKQITPTNMSNKPRFVTTTDRKSGIGIEEMVRTISLKNVPVQDSGSAADLAILAGLPARWVLLGARVVGKTQAGTLAAAVIDLRTAGAGGGSSVIDVTSTNSTLNTITANGKIKNLTPLAQTDVYTARRLFLRQTTNSANIGTVDLHLQIQDLGA